MTIELPRRQGYLYRENEILSPDGHCRPFDARAGGTVFGSGAGVVALRRLEDALREGDKVHAVIRCSAVNNDGKGKVSYLAPSVDGQAAAVEEALGIGDIDPASVSYIECHGTGTRLGDPIEIAALAQAYGSAHGDGSTCALGSVKSNIGHLDTAAGVAGLIKVVQALKHGELPPTLHFESPNPAMGLEQTPFSVQDRLTPWESAGPRRAGINSLGVGGTNAHAVLEQAPPQVGSEPVRQRQLLVLSARSPAALDRVRSRYAEHLDRSDQPLADIAHTAASGRRAFEYRCCAVGASRDEIARCLDGGNPDAVFVERRLPGDVGTVFLFAGGGAQYPNMGLDLYRREPVYREAIDRCLAAAARVVDFDLRRLLFPEGPDADGAPPELERPSRALPALLSAQYAQACLWRSCGVVPSACIGHSMGEYTAACLAGVFALEDAMAVVARRGELFERLAPGAMLSVMLSEEALLKEIGDEPVSIAAVNGPELCVASGSEASIAALTERLERQEVACQRIHISVAAHSTMVEPILEEFRRFLQGIDFRAPTIPVVSNLTGGWLTEAEARDPNYWVRHLRETVRFHAGMELLLSAEGSRALLEVGPGKTLISAARQHPGGRTSTATFASMRHVRESVDDQAFMLATLGRLWGCGAVENLAALHDGEDRLRVELPTYPFEHQAFWVEPGSAQPAGGGAGRRSMERWLYQPDWRPVAGPSFAPGGSRLAVLLGERDDELLRALRDVLRRESVDLVEVEAATAFGRIDAGRFAVDPASKSDYLSLFAEIGAHAYERVSVLHGWTLGEPVDSLRPSFDALLALSQAIGEQGWNEATLCVAATGSLSVGACDPPVDPLAASMLGACRVIPHEIADLKVRYIDTDLRPSAGGVAAAPPWLTERTATSVAAELLAHEPPASRAIACRHGQRFEEFYREVESVASSPALSTDGCYLISGGLGALGLEVAGHLASSLPDVRLVLLARTDLPPREGWPALAKRTGRDAERVRAVLALEARGATVRVAVADVCDRRALERAVASAVDDLGPVRGVLHTAGVIQDGLLTMKTSGEARAVLAPKIEGTVALSECTADQPLEFFVLFSSTSAIVGLPGQIDYAAGNAFMDAYARQRRAADGLPMISVNWSAWQRVGMAAEIAAGTRAEGLGFEPFEPRFEDASYRRCLSTDDWLLDEHRTKAGMPLVPGTGFLELSRCAARSGRLLDAERVLELRDVFFLAPLIVRDGERRVVDVSFRPGRGAADLADAHELAFSFRSATSPAAAEAGNWLEEHVQGLVTTVSRPSVPVRRSMDALIGRCDRTVIDHDGSREHDHMDFGERWGCLQRVHLGDGEAVAELALPERFEAELSGWELHPALLDMITAAAFRLAPDYRAERDFFVPVSYGRVTFHHAMQRHPPRARQPEALGGGRSVPVRPAGVFRRRRVAGGRRRLRRQADVARRAGRRARVRRRAGARHRRGPFPGRGTRDARPDTGGTTPRAARRFPDGLRQTAGRGRQPGRRGRGAVVGGAPRSRARTPCRVTSRPRRRPRPSSPGCGRRRSASTGSASTTTSSSWEATR